MKIKQIYIYILRLLPRVSCLRMQTHAPSVNGGCFVLRVLQSTTFFLLATCNSDFNRTDGFFLREFSDYNDNAFNGAWHASHSSALWRAFVLVHALVFIGRPRMSYLLCKCAFKRHAMPCRCSGFGAGRTSEMPFKSRHPIRSGSPERCTRRRNFADFIMTILSLISDRIKNVYTLYIVIKFILRWAKQIHWIREGPINDDFVLLRCRKKKYK